MLLARLALRNLTRQFRRTLMLGSAIVLGTAIFVTANAFARGISVTLFDKVIVWMTGHTGVFVSESGSQERMLFRDGPWLKSQMEGLPQVRRVDEAVGVMARALGPNDGDNVILVGVDYSKSNDSSSRKEFTSAFRLVGGRWDDLLDDSRGVPLVMAQEKAQILGLKVGDDVRLRFNEVAGARSAARGTLVGIFQTDNIFMQAPAFIELKRLRKLVGYRPWESSGFNLVLYNAMQDAVPIADSLQRRLHPWVASIGAHTTSGRHVRVYGLRGDSATRAKWMPYFGVPDSLALNKELALTGFASNESLALSWPLRYRAVGDSFATCDKNGCDSANATLTQVRPATHLADSVVLLREEAFWKLYLQNLPPRQRVALPADSAWIAPEWSLLDRPKSTEEFRKMMATVALSRGRGPVISVRTMFEAASDILKLESVLNLITLWGVVVLFLIILIGVLNTLRMTIRERTREIGTMRAIGFQASQIRSLFLLETLFLALFSGAVGIVAGFGLMRLLAWPQFHLENNPMGMLLVQGHLVFVPTWTGTVGGVALISILSLATAWWPARRAAALQPSDALRHHE